MDLRANYNHIGLGISLDTFVRDGVGPYIFSILPGGIGGTVDANGVYQAPYSKVGVDTIQVEDSLGEKATFKVFVGTALHLVCDIIKKFMGLGDQYVYIMNQKIEPVADDVMRVAVSSLSPKSFGSAKGYDASGEVISTSILLPVDITIYSKTTEAMIRKEEVIAALSSDYSQRQQELNAFSIGRLPFAMATIGGVEGASIPFAYNISFNLKYTSTIRKNTSFFDGANIDYNILTEV